MDLGQVWTSGAGSAETKSGRCSGRKAIYLYAMRWRFRGSTKQTFDGQTRSTTTNSGMKKQLGTSCNGRCGGVIKSSVQAGVQIVLLETKLKAHDRQVGTRKPRQWMVSCYGSSRSLTTVQGTGHNFDHSKLRMQLMQLRNRILAV